MELKLVEQKTIHSDARNAQITTTEYEIDSITVIVPYGKHNMGW